MRSSRPPSSSLLVASSLVAAVCADCHRAPVAPRPSAPSTTERPQVEVAAHVDETVAPPVRSEAWGTCDGRHPHGGMVHRLSPCDARIVASAVAWRPDALVTLGGGVIAPGRPACSTVQRGKVTAQLFDALGRAPWMILSGEGPPEPARPLDDVEARCVRVRLAQELAHPDAPRAILAAEAAALDAHTEAALTEADYLCATVLEARDEPGWSDTALGRMLFEPRSLSTVENARRSSTILRLRGIHRAVIVTTPVVRDGREVDNHARRALTDFELDRSHGLHHSRLGALACPDLEGGQAWSGFERDPALTPRHIEGAM